MGWDIQIEATFAFWVIWFKVHCGYVFWKIKVSYGSFLDRREVYCGWKEVNCG